MEKSLQARTGVNHRDTKDQQHKMMDEKQRASLVPAGTPGNTYVTNGPKNRPSIGLNISKNK